jgi:pseudaminic acid cytidylyltransferase
MNALAIILARGGSKRIPRKNIRTFHGSPIISYPIAAALASECFSEVMVSTDDEEIAAIAQGYGAVVPFLRSQANAGDQAGSDQAMAEVIREYQARGRHFDLVCAIYATAALVTPEHLRAGFIKLSADATLTSVLPVQRFSFPIQRALVLREGKAVLLQPEHYDTRSQDLEPTFHDVGQWYWLRSEPFLSTFELMGTNSAAVEVSELEAQDIDTEADWAMAELKYTRLYKNYKLT